MQSNLQLLIEELQREHDYLEQEINSCIRDWDFAGADAYREPLFQTRQKLRILKNLDNPLRDEIIALRKRIDYLNTLETNDMMTNGMVERNKLQIPELEAELSRLERQEKPFQRDGDELISCLELLLSREINTFVLQFSDARLEFLLSLHSTTLRIEIHRTDHKSLSGVTTSEGMSDLRNLSFQLVEDVAIKEIDAFQNHQILPVVQLLSKVTYDVFGLYGNKRAQIIVNPGLS